MKHQSITTVTLCLLASTSYAGYFTCERLDNGNHCYIKATPITQKAKKQHIVYCGNTALRVNNKGWELLNAYRKSGSNMVLRYTVDGEYITSPCN